MKKKDFCILVIFMLSTFLTKVNAQNYLSEKQVRLITISAFTARGELDKLKAELNGGLDEGLTVNEIKEIMVHLYAYSGFPRSIRGLQTLMEVLDFRKSNGINDTWGREASPIFDTRSKYDRGKEILANLLNTALPEGHPTSGYAAFCPEIEIFLKEHLFSDLFERDILTYAQREMVTTSVLIGLGGLAPMLKSHIKLSLNVGISPNQLTEMILTLENRVNKENTEEARLVLSEIMLSKNKDTSKN